MIHANTIHALIKEIIPNITEEQNMHGFHLTDVQTYLDPLQDSLNVMVIFNNEFHVKITLDRITMVQGPTEVVESIVTQLKDLEWRIYDQMASKIIDKVINE